MKLFINFDQHIFTAAMVIKEGMGKRVKGVFGIKYFFVGWRHDKILNFKRKIGA